MWVVVKIMVPFWGTGFKGPGQVPCIFPSLPARWQARNLGYKKARAASGAASKRKILQSLTNPKPFNIHLNKLALLHVYRNVTDTTNISNVILGIVGILAY